MPPRLLRSPVSSTGTTSRRSAVMRIDCFRSSSPRRRTSTTCDQAWAEVTARSRPPAAGLRTTGFVACNGPRLDSPRWPTPRRSPGTAYRRGPTDGCSGRTRSRKAYFLLTKPRVIELLLVTTVPAMILAAGELPSLVLIADGARRWRARGRWREHHQLLDRARPRPADAPHRAPAAPDRRRSRPMARSSSGSCSRSARSRCSGRRSNLLSAVARGQRHALLRLRVHDLAEAAQPAEHRHRRRRRRGAGARRLGGGHRRRSPRRRG